MSSRPLYVRQYSVARDLGVLPCGHMVFSRYPAHGGGRLEASESCYTATSGVLGERMSMVAAVRFDGEVPVGVGVRQARDLLMAQEGLTGE